MSMSYRPIKSKRSTRSRAPQKEETRLTLLCKRDEFIFRSPRSDSAEATIMELAQNQRTWDTTHGVWRLAPTDKVFLHIIQLCQDYFRTMPEIMLHDKLTMDEIVEGKTLDLSTHYSTLGVPSTAEPLQIKKAYRRAAHIYHPDKKGPDEGKYFVAVNQAYECLMNPIKRKRYDAALRVLAARHEADLGEYRRSVFSY